MGEGATTTVALLAQPVDQLVQRPAVLTAVAQARPPVPADLRRHQRQVRQLRFGSGDAPGDLSVDHAPLYRSRRLRPPPVLIRPQRLRLCVPVLRPVSRRRGGRDGPDNSLRILRGFRGPRRQGEQRLRRTVITVPKSLVTLKVLPVPLVDPATGVHRAHEQDDPEDDREDIGGVRRRHGYHSRYLRIT